MYYPFLSPIETLTLYGELQGLQGKKLQNEIHELLEELGLGHVKTKQNRSISKGQLQRVGIAQSLLGEPKLLILDEVTSGLDPIGRRELREILRARREKGATLFFSSHELAEVDMLCDRVLLINQGRLIEERNMSSVKNEIRKFSIRFSGQLDLANYSTKVQVANGATCAEFSSKSKLIEALSLVQQNGYELLDVHSEEGSLEDYFVSTIQGAAA
jgi:ABC-2 type transport system ATP-binding protein